MEVYEMATSKKVASDAGKILENKRTSAAMKRVAASDLAQSKKGRTPQSRKSQGRRTSSR